MVLLHSSLKTPFGFSVLISSIKDIITSSQFSCVWTKFLTSKVTNLVNRKVFAIWAIATPDGLHLLFGVVAGLVGAGVVLWLKRIR